MSENQDNRDIQKKQAENTPAEGGGGDQDDLVVTIPLKRHLWPDEAALKKEKKKTKKLKKLCIVLSVVFLAGGWFGGSLLPLPKTVSMRYMIQSAFGLSSENKVDEVRDIMENSWYFSKDISDLDDRLTDQAIRGMTDNDEDTHTEYMSKEEEADFVQSINRNYVGIGAQFIMYSSRAMVTKVFNGSPAEQAGLQAGDIIAAVDGKSMTGADSSAIKEAIQGEEGTQVVLGIVRDGQSQDITITRGAVSATAYARMLDDNMLYLQLYQFGDSTAQDVKNDLDSLIGDQDSVSMILDLRGNGGGYLNSVQALASLFLNEGDVIMKQEFTDGTSTSITADKGKYEQIHHIVILVDSGTASAAEVCTLALKQNRDDVTVIGKTTYGKGTVQTTTEFQDGSALKYTNSRWLSPDGTWINGIGITPDQDVDLDEALTMTYPSMNDGDSYGVDSVSDVVKAVQTVLKYFGYDPGRTDGYFSQDTLEAWHAFENDHSMQQSDVIDYTGYMNALAEVTYDWATSTAHDSQLAAAKEALHG